MRADAAVVEDEGGEGGGGGQRGGELSGACEADEARAAVQDGEAALLQVARHLPPADLLQPVVRQQQHPVVDRRAVQLGRKPLQLGFIPTC